MSMVVTDNASGTSGADGGLANTQPLAVLT